MSHTKPRTTATTPWQRTHTTQIVVCNKIGVFWGLWTFGLIENKIKMDGICSRLFFSSSSSRGLKFSFTFSITLDYFSLPYLLRFLNCLFRVFSCIYFIYNTTFCFLFVFVVSRFLAFFVVTHTHVLCPYFWRFAW